MNCAKNMRGIRVGSSEQAEAVDQLLVEFYGEPQWQAGADPVETLIGTILSANTNDINSGRALDQLKTRFEGDWDTVRTAPLTAIKTAIRPAGMYNQKAPNLVATLAKIYADRGGYDLEFLSEMPVTEALDYLTALPGVGHKTASIVLLFCFNHGSFPVDTHVQRISQRLGISRRSATPARIKQIWESLLPPERYYPLHVNLIRHGRQLCLARKPQCSKCPLQSQCDYFKQAAEWSTRKNADL